MDLRTVTLSANYCTVVDLQNNLQQLLLLRAGYFPWNLSCDLKYRAIIRRQRLDMEQLAYETTALLP